MYFIELEEEEYKYYISILWKQIDHKLLNMTIIQTHTKANF